MNAWEFNSVWQVDIAIGPLPQTMGMHAPAYDA